MTKQDIIDYVTTTPHNTNRAVLSTMLDSFEVGDNKKEIEFLATENGVFTPHEGKVFNKVTVNVPEIQLDTLLDTITLTENGTTNAQKGRGFKTVNVNVPAPPSDITTAEVTAVYGGDDLDIDFLAIPTITNDVISINEITSGVFTVPLYKGVMKIEAGGSEATSGNCENVGDYIVITGDCTITVK